MSQFAFSKALLTVAKENGLHNCLDTCGFASFDKYKNLIDNKLVDVFLYDYKESDEEKHFEYTAVPLQPIIDNLREIDRNGGKIILRCPIIPGLNNRRDHFEGIANLANSLENIIHIDINPYHPLGESKSERIGKDYRMGKQVFPDEETVNDWMETIRERARCEVKNG